jgi:hypothetical protein
MSGPGALLCGEERARRWLESADATPGSAWPRCCQWPRHAVWARQAGFPTGYGWAGRMAPGASADDPGGVGRTGYLTSAVAQSTTIQPTPGKRRSWRSGSGEPPAGVAQDNRTGPCARADKRADSGVWRVPWQAGPGLGRPGVRWRDRLHAGPGDGPLGPSPGEGVSGGFTPRTGRLTPARAPRGRPRGRPRGPCRADGTRAARCPRPAG